MPSPGIRRLMAPVSLGNAYWTKGDCDEAPVLVPGYASAASPVAHPIAAPLLPGW